MAMKKLRGGSGADKCLSQEEQEVKIMETKKMIGSVADKFPTLCSNASMSRYLRARNWNTKKACKMLKDSMKWRLEYKPEKIRWEHIAQEAETGKVYRANFCDKFGRAVLIIRPGCQNSNSTVGQVKYLVYCLENAILNSDSNQEQMVWLINFQGWNASCISLKVTQEAAQILQNHYPERLALAIFYNPPKVFESFWTVIKPFFEPNTYKKVRFIYSENPESRKSLEEVFEMDKLETSFGGKSTDVFNFEAYAQRMKEDDKKMSGFVNSGCSSPTSCQSPFLSEQVSEASDDEKFSCSAQATPSSIQPIDEKLGGLKLQQAGESKLA